MFFGHGLGGGGGMAGPELSVFTGLEGNIGCQILGEGELGLYPPI